MVLIPELSLGEEFIPWWTHSLVFSNHELPKSRNFITFLIESSDVETPPLGQHVCLVTRILVVNQILTCFIPASFWKITPRLAVVYPWQQVGRRTADGSRLHPGHSADCGKRQSEYVENDVTQDQDSHCTSVREDSLVSVLLRLQLSSKKRKKKKS